MKRVEDIDTENGDRCAISVLEELAHEVETGDKNQYIMRVLGYSNDEIRRAFEYAKF